MVERIGVWRSVRYIILARREIVEFYSTLHGNHVALHKQLGLLNYPGGESKTILSFLYGYDLDNEIFCETCTLFFVKPVECLRPILICILHLSSSLNHVPNYKALVY